MSVKYFRIEKREPRAYGFIHDGTILAIDGNREWIIGCKWCGGGVAGYCYRPVVAGFRKEWPKAADAAIDKVAEFKKIILDSDGLISWADDLTPKEIRELLGL